MEIDRKSAHILVKLAEMEEATAGELRDALGVEQNQSVHYRMDNKLIPQHLVLEKPEREEQAGSRKAARVYRISPDGRDWVNEHGHKITLTDLDAAEQEIQRLTAEVQDLSSDVESLKDWRQKRAGKAGGMSTRLSEIGDTVEQLEKLTKKHEQRDFSKIWDRLHDLDSRMEKHAEKLPRGAIADVPQLREVEADVRDLSERIADVESRLDNIQETQNQYNEWANSTNARLNEIEEKQSKGILRRLLPF